MVDQEPITSEIFDVAQAFKDMNSKIDSIETTMSSLSKKIDDAEPTTPKTEEPPKEDKEKEDMAVKLGEYETKAKDSILTEISEISGNEEVKAELKDFSNADLEKILKLSKTKTVNFGKTNKGNEGTDDSDKKANLEAKMERFEQAGLGTESIQAELDTLK